MRTVALSETPKRIRSSRLLLQAAVEALGRPYRVTPGMVLLVSLVPFYIFIPAVLLPGRTLYAPSVWLDGVIPLHPVWAFVYGALYLCLIVLPVLAIREHAHIRRTVSAYLFIWVTAYICFVVYPTAAPRPPTLHALTFGNWGLRLLYSADPPFNCFPSLHVAHSFVSALACYRLSRPLGLACSVAALMVALSTLFTKQHYVLDVVAGIGLALVAYSLFLWRYSPVSVREHRHVAAVLALGLLATTLAAVAGLWTIYHLRAG